MSAEELNTSLKSSFLWQYVQKLTLTTNMRVQLQHDVSAERFIKQLLDIENGKMTIEKHTHCITLTRNFCNIIASKDDFITEVFSNIAQKYKNHEWLSARAILAAKKTK